MTELEGCIRFWEAKLRHDGYLLDPGTQASIEQTVKFLKELKAIKNNKGKSKIERV